MTDIKTFRLPDLGEGLPDATIVEWLVKEGETIRLDQPMISMETAKAIVEVPSPYSGKVVKVYGGNGDVIATGAPLVDFDVDANAPQRAEGHSMLHHEPAPPASTERVDTGTVVGEMEASDRVVREAAVAVGGVRAVPAVRALARKLRVDLARVTPTGADGVVTINDVKQAAAHGLSSAPMSAGATARAPPPSRLAPATTSTPAATAPPRQSLRTRPDAAQNAAAPAYGEAIQLKGVRRNMARVMADALGQVVPTTICDDADIHAWQSGEDVSVRLLRAITQACRAVPALNAWFDGDALTRTLHAHVDVGIAVDTADGLFVPALRNVDVLDALGIRSALDDLLRQVRERSIPPSELAGYTISLSNFGVFAGRYATPIVVPPCVAIVAAGKLRHQVVPVLGGIEAHRVIPLSLAFDHRAATGGEAARFLKAMLEDLALAG